VNDKETIEYLEAKLDIVTKRRDRLEQELLTETTIRDQFAMAALTGLLAALANPIVSEDLDAKAEEQGIETEEVVINTAFAIASAAMKARKK